MALRLAAQGIPVFPCNAAKRPTTLHGFHDAVTDEGEVYRLWHGHPGPLVGIPCGLASGIDLLDIDPRHGGDLWLAEKQEMLGETLVIRTRSGGEHWIYQHTPGVVNSQAKIAPGVDIRGQGGYLIYWPGSGGEIIRRNKPAQWPAWMLDLLLPKPQPEEHAERWKNRLANSDTAVRRLIQRQLDRVARANPGARHFRLRAAARTIGGLLDLDEETTSSDVAAQLLSAVRSAGGKDINKKNAEATIKWGLEKGAAKPLTMKVSNG